MTTKLHDGLSMRAHNVLRSAGVNPLGQSATKLKKAIQLMSDPAEPYKWLRLFRQCGHNTAVEILKFAKLATPEERRARCSSCHGTGWVMKKISTRKTDVVARQKRAVRPSAVGR